MRCAGVPIARQLLLCPSRAPRSAFGQVVKCRSMSAPQQVPQDMVDFEEYSSRWEQQIWGKEGGLKPGEAFDRCRASPALVNLLTSGRLDVSGKHVFVPGCGRGYDLVEFVRAGAAAATGLELAPTAQREASAYLSEHLSVEQAVRAQVLVGDFYKWSQPTEQSAFDVGFDYTFLCAMHPGMRQDWAAGWARHLPAGGRLVCIVYPVDPNREMTGPPWPVSPDLYHQLLEPQGFKCEMMEPIPPELSHPDRAGREQMAIFVRQE